MHRPIAALTIVAVVSMATAVPSYAAPDADRVRAVLDVDFLREGAEWKACRYSAGQST